MTQVKVRLPGSMETSLIMLYGLAVDSETDPTVLGDRMAAQAFNRVDYDFNRLRGKVLTPKTMTKSVVARAKFFDEWTKEFLAAHEQATVLHLGAGMDPRVWRVDPGPGVRWYDIDQSGVVDARRELFPEREHYQLIPASVTDPDWLDQIPTEHPVLVIAQGLTMYLPPAEGHALFRRITERFASGTIVLDTHNWLGVRGVNKVLNRQFGAPLLHWPINDARELERHTPALRCTDAVGAMSPEAAGVLPADTVPRGATTFGRIAGCVPPLRDLSLYARYRFGDA